MAELESVIEKNLIEQLCYGKSQWTYREDLKTEKDLWKNIKYILEQNNKAKLDGELLSDTEFEQVKNQLQFSSFYDAGRWLVGENGRVYVHVQRGNETLHLEVMNHEQIAGGTSVYEVINQYQAFKDNDEEDSRNRRFDVSLLINGIPMIHIELKNRSHSYMEGFYQIKKYIEEGKFKGIFSMVQMFVVSNAVDTRYFSAARFSELNPKFMCSWLDADNKPVADYLQFANEVLRIPQAHEMVSRYTVLDNDRKRLLLLRPYQIHAIESIRNASRKGESGYIWHTTGSGKTLTSYKVTRNLLMDIPSIEKTIFLIDRKDLDDKTTMDFQSYAENDVVDVDETDNVTDLIKKLSNNDRQMIVTTIQKMRIMMRNRLNEQHKDYAKIKSLKVAFVVDECHRTVTPEVKREFEKFFTNSLWYGFTGTPHFAENAYEQKGDLPRTTEELYGKALHTFTIKNGIREEAVLGFMIENLGDNNSDLDDVDATIYDTEKHMLSVLDVILNKSYHKLGMQNGKGNTYEAILTVNSIERAQKYYDLLMKVKNGETSLQINDKVKKALPDFPKAAITYSISENEEDSKKNQDKMKESLNEYNNMFGTHYGIEQIDAYNKNLNERLARKNRFKSRHQQLDLVIVVDRLLTGFDAPCISTLFVDRQPMKLHDIIQAFSRTNRLFDYNKKYGQIVTFQSPKKFKAEVDNALKLFSAGGIGEALANDWEEVEAEFIAALADLKAIALRPEDTLTLTIKEKKKYVKQFQRFDRLLSQLRNFVNFEDKCLDDYGTTELEYADYAAHYRNIIDEFKAGDDTNNHEVGEDDSEVIDIDYELVAYACTTVDYEYILNLIQDIVSSTTDDDFNETEREKVISEVQEYVVEFTKTNPKIGGFLSKIVDEIIKDKDAYKGQDISNIIEDMRSKAIYEIVTEFADKWCLEDEAVEYAVSSHKEGMIPNETVLRESIDYKTYKEKTEEPLSKLRCRSVMIEELQEILETEIIPLQQR